MFTPVNIDAKLVVTWYENAPQLSNTSLLDALPVTYTYTASSVIHFNYPVYCPGAKELGRIENQDSKFQGAANDSTACVMYGDDKHTLSSIVQEDAVEVWNYYWALNRVESTKPSLNDYIECSVVPTTISVGTTHHTVYGVTFILHMYNTRSNPSAVSFFIVDNTESSTTKTPRLITLSTRENQQTVRLFSSSKINFDILKSNSYANSSFSYVGGGKFVTISAVGTQYFTLDLTDTDASVKSFHLSANSDGSGLIVNDNYGTASSCSYCTIPFKRPAAQYTKLRIHYIQDSEQNYDYGIFSKINKWLCPYPVADSTNTSDNKKIFTGYGSEVVEHSCKGESGENVITYSISSLDLNTLHCINVKYIKDASYDGGHDEFAITKIEFVEDVEYDFHYDTAENYYTLTVNNHGSADAHFE